MNLRKLEGLASTLRNKSEVAMDTILRREPISAEERVAAKHMAISAATQERMNDMRAAAGEAPLPANEVQRFLVRAGFKLGRWYSTAEVNRLLQASDLDPTEKIACRLELEQLGMVLESGA